MASTTSECLQPMTSAASSDTFLDECDGVDVDAVSGTVVIYLLMCVLVLN